MTKSTARPPRLFVFVWFIAAVGVLAGGLLLQAMGWSGSMGLQGGSELMLAYVLGAFMIGLGIGEWRGLKHARHLRGSAD